MTQNETSLYEMPADRMVFTHQGLGEGRELGEMEIVSTIWGKAKVRPVNDQGMSGWAWFLTTLAVLGVIATVWVLLAGKGTGSPEPTLLVTPDQTVTEPIPPLQNTAEIHPAQTPSVPAPAMVNAPEPAKPAQLDAVKPAVTAEKTPAAASEKRIGAGKANNRDMSVEAHIAAQPSSAEIPGKKSATTSPPSTSTATPSGQAKQGGLVKQSDTVNAAGSNVSVSTKFAPPKAESPKAAPSQNALPAKSEPPAKPDMTDTHP